MGRMKGAHVKVAQCWMGTEGWSFGSQEEAVWAQDQKSMLLRLKRWLSGVDNQFLLQRTWVQFLLPSWRLTIPVLEVTAPSLGHWGHCINMVHKYALRQTHTDKRKINLFIYFFFRVCFFSFGGLESFGEHSCYFPAPRFFFNHRHYLPI